jgi:peptidoglycan/xylan/chitin deacetylase (PgdA/CDA1 family)
MRLVSPILQRVVYPILSSVGYFYSHFASVVEVITYHGVLPSGYKSKDAFLDNTLVSREAFRSQLRLLKKYYNVIPPEQFRLWLRGEERLPERAIMLTCDDGLLNHVTEMLPILREEQLKCLFFVTASSLRRTPEILWYTELYQMLMEASKQDKAILLRGIAIPKLSGDLGERRVGWLELVRSLSRIQEPARRAFIEEMSASLGLPLEWRKRYLDDPLLRIRFQFLQLSQLKQLADAGMTIGAHTLSHPVLVEQSRALARSEIAEPRTALENALGRQVWAIAYPFGDPSSVGSREYELAEEAGYECAFVNVGGVLDPLSARFALPRIHVTGEMSLSVYEAYISGVHEALRNWLRPQTGGA